MKVNFSKGTYYEDKFYWQCVIIPSISFLRGFKNEHHSGYLVINFEWLFWNVSIDMYL